MRDVIGHASRRITDGKRRGNSDNVFYLSSIQVFVDKPVNIGATRHF
jgi:hypothetical protein